MNCVDTEEGGGSLFQLLS